MDPLRNCTCCDKELPPASFPREVGDCEECCAKRFLIDMFESPKSEQHYWKFRAWSTTAYDTKSLLEEESEYFHIEVMQKNLRINLGIKKKTNTEDEYLIWVGDKQFIVKATPVTPETIELGEDSGKVLSTHEVKDRLE